MCSRRMHTAPVAGRMCMVIRRDMHPGDISITNMILWSVIISLLLNRCRYRLTCCFNLLAAFAIADERDSDSFQPRASVFCSFAPESAPDAASFSDPFPAHPPAALPQFDSATSVTAPDTESKPLSPTITPVCSAATASAEYSYPPVPALAILANRAKWDFPRRICGCWGAVPH